MYLHIARETLPERIRLVNRVVKSTNQKHFLYYSCLHFVFFLLVRLAGCVTKNWGDEPINLG